MNFTWLALLTLAAAAALSSAEEKNQVTFVSQDSIDRTIYFTANAGTAGAAVAPVRVAGGRRATAEFPRGWVGNFFAVSDGAPVVPGMLGEVAFDGWGGLTYFDVSAIVNPHDHVGVKQLWPAASGSPVSGCDVFPCPDAYYHPDDVQTKATPERHLVCTLGTRAGSGPEKRAGGEEGDGLSKLFPREFVLGHGSLVEME